VLETTVWHTISFVHLQTDYPSACNSTETLIVHESLLHSVWPVVGRALLEANVRLLCDPATLSVLQSFPTPPSNLSLAGPSTPEAYTTEHLTLTLSVIALPSLPAAVRFINAHSSHHTDCIVTESQPAAASFCRGVDSAGTFVNASTRFADGFRYGFGTEVGISTGRIHARGPVGLEGLVIYKYMLRSTGATGHIVGDFGAGGRRYKHADIAPTLPF
jgi:glutamate-5-semialdehyde dehydrogenase